MSYNPNIQLVECPRDAIQGITHFIDTEKKVAYINQLVRSNLFEYIDCGSFVSPKAVPQMQDTAAVLADIELINETRLLAIVANERGAEAGLKSNNLAFLGYPFSISETFQQRNANSNITESFQRVKHIQQLLAGGSKELIVYISMAFGNPYGDMWSLDLVVDWISKLSALGVKRFSIADTTAEAIPEQINELFTAIYNIFPRLDFSIHLHSSRPMAALKIEAAYAAGCRRFEGAFLGYGGCPFAKDELVGNIPMEMLIDRFQSAPPAAVFPLMDGFQNMITPYGV